MRARWGLHFHHPLRRDLAGTQTNSRSTGACRRARGTGLWRLHTRGTAEAGAECSEDKALQVTAGHLSCLTGTWSSRERAPSWCWAGRLGRGRGWISTQQE